MRLVQRKTGRERFYGVATAAIVSACAFAGSARAQATEVAVPPVVVTHVDPVYPPAEIPKRTHADVLLAITVDSDGHVTNVEIVTGSTPAIDEAAIVAARQWTFIPAKRGAKPIASRIRVPFHFAPPEAAPEVVEPKPTGTPELPAHNAVPGAPPPEPAAEEVSVVGHRKPPSVGASDFDLEIGAQSYVPRQNAQEMLKLAPGILLSNEGGEGHAEQVFMRGFDAREGQDVEFTVNGVPINESGNLHGNGYADTHFIIPELVERLRVVEGPFDPRQGNYAVAGSADYQLGLAKRGFTGKYTGGSFGTNRMLLTWGPAEESRHTFAGAEIYSTDGYGQNRDAKRASAMAQYEGRIGARGTWHLTAQGFSTHYHSAGVVREDDYRSGRMGFYDSYASSTRARQATTPGGDSSRFSIAADIDTRMGDTALQQQVFFIKRDMRLIEDFTGYLLDTQQPLQSLHLQRGDELDLSVNEITVGAKGSAKWETRALDQKQGLELGYFARGDQASGTQQRLEASTGVPYLTETDLSSTLVDIGMYADADLHATSWLTFRGGARADLFDYDVSNNCAAQSVSHPSATNPPIDQSCLTQQNFGRPREANQRTTTASTAVLPKGSILIGPLRHFMLSASYGQGARSIDPSYVTQDVKTPFASVSAYETGLSYTRTIGETDVVARSIFFQTHVDRDLIFSETAGRNVLGVGTTRTGWVGATRITGKFFDESANVTFVRSAYDDTHLLVAYVPDVVFRSDTAIFGELPITIAGKKLRGAFGTGLTYVGPRALPYGQRSQDIFTVDASATLGWRNFELGILSTNLLGRQYRLGEYNYASDFHSQSQPTLVPERTFTAGAPRGIFGTFAVNFGGS